MGLMTFSTALSGLATNSQGLNVVSNNLANLNTVGFKSSNVNFTDVLGQMFSVAGTPQSGTLMSIGLGAQVGSVRRTMGQGSIQTTSNPLDVAIEGKGFFVVKNSGGQFYTRAGNLHLDSNGSLVTDNGSEIQGYLRNASTGKIDTTLGLGAIKLPANVNNPVPTSMFEMALNLDAGAADGTQFNTSVQIYDSLGNSHIATLKMQKEISGGATPVTRWRYDITIPNNEIAGVPSTDTQQFSLITGAVSSGAPTAGALVFDSAGNLTSAYTGPDPGTLPPVADVTFPPSTVTLPPLTNGGVFKTSLTWKILDGQGTPEITGFGSPTTVTASAQDGTGAGTLTNFAIGPDGTITAVFSNGQISDVAQIVLAQFANEDGLVQAGGGFYAESVASGDSFIGAPSEGGRGQLLSAALESSNVDLASELTKIITYQRGYQANARVISVTDQIMQETMNMKQ